jgi:hypothetical protein
VSISALPPSSLASSSGDKAGGASAQPGDDGEAPGSSAGPVAVSVSSPIAPMDLAVFGLATAPQSAAQLVAVPFSEVGGLRSATAVYPGIAGAGANWARVRAAVANFGSTPRQVTILLSEGNGAAATQKKVATINLAPYSVSLVDPVDVSDATSAGASLTVASDGPPGDVASTVEALTANAVQHAVTLPWKDLKQWENGGQHPWRRDRGLVSTIVAL